MKGTTTQPVIRLRFYTDSAGEWRWTVRAVNGEPLAVSSEGYRDRDDAIAGAATTLGLLAHELRERADDLQSGRWDVAAVYRNEDDAGSLDVVNVELRNDGENEPTTHRAVPR